jgi:hypothetical protein
MEQVNKLISYDFEHLSPSTTTFDYSNLLFLDDEDLSSIKDENVKQKILEFFEYYSFLKNNLNIFLNIFEILKNSNMNKPFFFDLKSCFPDEELFLLFLSASILRVLVKPVLSFKKNEYSFE